MFLLIEYIPFYPIQKRNVYSFQKRRQIKRAKATEAFSLVIGKIKVKTENNHGGTLERMKSEELVLGTDVTK